MERLLLLVEDTDSFSAALLRGLEEPRG